MAEGVVGEKSSSTQADPPRRAVVSAAAKINLGLRVLGSRPDGYHLLESLFVPIDLADELQVEVAPARAEPAVVLSLESPPDAGSGVLADVPADERNLVVRAAHGFLERSRMRIDFDLRLRLLKRIPVAAGLGGGSSDAAALLRALETLFPGALPPRERAALALSLGADVPFFLDPRPALVSGIGERIEFVERLPRFDLVLVNPGDSVATSQVYGVHDVLAGALTPAPPGYTMRAISALTAAGQEDGGEFARCLGELSKNDLEPAALRLCPPIGRLKRQLLAAGAMAAGMSGSGATVYGIFASEASARVGLETLALGESAWVRLAVSQGSR